MKIVSAVLYLPDGSIQQFATDLKSMDGEDVAGWHPCSKIVSVTIHGTQIVEIHGWKQSRYDYFKFVGVPATIGVIDGEKRKEEIVPKNAGGRILGQSREFHQERGEPIEEALSQAEIWFDVTEVRYPGSPKVLYVESQYWIRARKWAAPRGIQVAIYD
jgi:hypothetical protein